jgi:hypothetical protein
MLKLVAVAVLSTLAAAGLAVAAVAAVSYVAGDSASLSSITAIAFVVGLVALLVALVERSHRRSLGPSGSAIGGRARDDRDTGRTLDELRAMNGNAGAAPARHVRLHTM